MSTELIELGHCSVTVSLPVQYRLIKEGSSVSTFDLRVGGSAVVYDALPQEAKIEIARQVAVYAAR